MRDDAIFAAFRAGGFEVPNDLCELQKMRTVAKVLAVHIRTEVLNEVLGQVRNDGISEMLDNAGDAVDPQDDVEGDPDVPRGD